MQRQVELIGAAWGLGGVDAGCAEAPSVLAPLIQVGLRARGVPVLFGPMLAPLPVEKRKRLALSRLCGQLAGAVGASLRAGRLPCVLGGDHTCAAGTWSGVARALPGPLGLVWVDAHMDSHTPATSPSGRMHGMPLAWLLGEDDDRLCGLDAGVLDARRVCLVGVRSFEPEEAQRLARLGVRVFFIEEIERRGLDAVFDEALRVVTEGTAGFGVSIDLDAITPEEAPGVATPAPHGIRSRELAKALARAGGDPRLAALELVEYCPRLDRGARTAQVAVDLLLAALSGARDDPQVLADALERKQP
jgi:arginase